MHLRRLLWCGLVVAAFLLIHTTKLHALDAFAGTYVCSEMRVGGHTTRCVSPPLILFPDGTYQIWREQGTYTIKGGRLVLSEGRKRGQGRLKRGLKIEFQFTRRGKRLEIVFRRDPYLPPGTAVT